MTWKFACRIFFARGVSCQLGVNQSRVSGNAARVASVKVQAIGKKHKCDFLNSSWFQSRGYCKTLAAQLLKILKFCCIRKKLYKTFFNLLTGDCNQKRITQECTKQCIGMRTWRRRFPFEKNLIKYHIKQIVFLQSLINFFGQMQFKLLSNWHLFKVHPFCILLRLY